MMIWSQKDPHKLQQALQEKVVFNGSLFKKETRIKLLNLIKKINLNFKSKSYYPALAHKRNLTIPSRKGLVLFLWHSWPSLSQ